MFFGFLKPKKKYPERDRRCEPRCEAEDEFMLEIVHAQAHYIGAGRDISVNGIRFVTTCKLSAGKGIILELRFPAEFPGTKHLRVRARVARVYKPRGTERYRVGCRMIHDKEEGKEAVRQFIYWLENKNGK